MMGTHRASLDNIAVAAKHGLAILITLLMAACSSGALRTRPQEPGHRAPYPKSRLISAVTWDFSTVVAQRQAHGSDLWPCAWAIDDNLYCAWGDGGGFDGNDDNIGRASLGFARVAGTPDSSDPAAVVGKNIWGSPPYAEQKAEFGGKVGSLIAVDGVLFANGGFWTTADTPDPVHKSGRGPLSTIAWSNDSARSWHLASWSSPTPLGSFLDTGREPSKKPDYVYLYYLRSGDDQHVYLERIRPENLTADPATSHRSEYFIGTSWNGAKVRWSDQEPRATPVFSDRNHAQGPTAVYDAGLRRYLLTVGHYASGNDDDSSAGQVGLFESPHPWGPWSTVGYYENWGDLNAETTGDFLSLRIPSKWLSSDGRVFWAVFSGLKSFDSFNIAKGVLSVR